MQTPHNWFAQYVTCHNISQEVLYSAHVDTATRLYVDPVVFRGSLLLTHWFWPLGIRLKPTEITFISHFLCQTFISIFLSNGASDAHPTVDADLTEVAIGSSLGSMSAAFQNSHSHILNRKLHIACLKPCGFIPLCCHSLLWTLLCLYWTERLLSRKAIWWLRGQHGVWVMFRLHCMHSTMWSTPMWTVKQATKCKPWFSVSSCVGLLLSCTQEQCRVERPRWILVTSVIHVTGWIPLKRGGQLWSLLCFLMC